MLQMQSPLFAGVTMLNAEMPIRRKLYPINQSTIFIRGANVQKQIAGSLGRYIVRNWHLALLCITIYSGERIFMVKGDPRNPQT